MAVERRFSPWCVWTPFALETRFLPRSGQGRPDPRPWAKTAQTRATSGPATSRHGTELGEVGHSLAVGNGCQLRGQDPAHRERRRMSQRSGGNGTPAAARPDPPGKAALRLVVLRILERSDHRTAPQIAWVVLVRLESTALPTPAPPVDDCGAGSNPSNSPSGVATFLPESCCMDALFLYMPRPRRLLAATKRTGVIATFSVILYLSRPTSLDGGIARRRTERTNATCYDDASAFPRRVPARPSGCFGFPTRSRGCGVAALRSQLSAGAVLVNDYVLMAGFEVNPTLRHIFADYDARMAAVVFRPRSSSSSSRGPRRGRTRGLRAGG